MRTDNSRTENIFEDTEQREMKKEQIPVGRAVNEKKEV